MDYTYNQHSEDWGTLDHPVTNSEDIITFEDGTTMDVHEDSSLMEQEIALYVSHATDEQIAKIYDFVCEVAPLPSSLNKEDTVEVSACIRRQCEFFNNSTGQQERTLFDALHLNEREAIAAWLHQHFDDLNEAAQFGSASDELDKLHKATNMMELVQRAYPADSQQDSAGSEEVPDIKAHVEEARAFIEGLTSEEMNEFGHDTINGRDQMEAALDTIEKLAELDNATAWDCYTAFMESNLSGVHFVIEKK